MLVGYSPDGFAPRPGARDELARLARRQDLNLSHPPRRDLAGRCAAHGKRRRLHLQLHHHERPVRLHALHDRHRQGGRHRPLHGQVHPRQAQGRHAAPVGANRAAARVEQDLGQSGPEHVREPGADRGLGSVPGGRGEEGRLHPPRGQQALLGRRSQGRRGHLPGLPERRDHGRRPEGRQHPGGRARARRRVQPALLDGRRDPHREQRGRREVFRRARLQLLRQPRLDGQPGPPRPQVPPGALLGRSTNRSSSRSPTAAAPCRARRSSCRASNTPGSRLPAKPSASTWPRPARCLPRPATPSRTACA